MTSLHLAVGLLLVLVAPEDFDRERVVGKLRETAVALGCRSIRVEVVDHRRRSHQVVLHVTCLDREGETP